MSSRGLAFVKNTGQPWKGKSRVRPLPVLIYRPHCAASWLIRLRIAHCNDQARCKLSNPRTCR